MSSGRRAPSRSRTANTERARGHSYPDLSAQIRLALQLDRNPVKLIAAQRSPRIATRRDTTDTARCPQQSSHSANDEAPTIDELVDASERAAVSHLPEFLYNWNALRSLQAATDAALRVADRAHTQLVEIHRHVKRRQTGLNGTVSPPQAPAVSFAAMINEIPVTSSHVLSRRRLSAVNTGLPSADGVLEWMAQHAETHPNLWPEFCYWERSKHFCVDFVADTFTAARSYFETNLPLDVVGFGSEADTLIDSAVAAALAAGDYIFAVDPRVVEMLTAEIVCEAMEHAALDAIFLSAADDELLAALGTTALKSWIDASSDPPGDAQTGTDVVGSNVVPLTFVVRRSQSNAAVMRKLQRRLAEYIVTFFDKEMESLRQEAAMCMMLGEDPQ